MSKKLEQKPSLTSSSHTDFSYGRFCGVSCLNMYSIRLSLTSLISSCADGVKENVCTVCILGFCETFMFCVWVYLFSQTPGRLAAALAEVYGSSVNKKQHGENSILWKIERGRGRNQRGVITIC